MEQERRYAKTGAAVRGVARRLVDVIRLNHELRVKALATDPSVPTASPGTKWDQANSDPVMSDAVR